MKELTIKDILKFYKKCYFYLGLKNCECLNADSPNVLDYTTLTLINIKYLQQKIKKLKYYDDEE